VNSRIHVFGLAALFGAATACISSNPYGTTGTGGTPGTGGVQATGGTKGSGGVTSSGGMTGGTTGGTTGAGTGGVTATGGVPGTGGVTATGGSSGTGGAAGASAVGGHAGGAGMSGAAGAGGGASGGACTRDFLKSTVDAYFTALAAHSTSTLPLASNVKFTENGKVSPVGTAGLWTTAGMLKFSITAYDTDGCNTASEAVVPDGSTDIPFALRLKIVNQQITEIETIAVRAGDYKVSGSNFASDTGAIIMSDTSIHWETAIDASQANTSDQMNAWMLKYFNLFPAGVCNTASSCKRLENGGGSFSCSAGASCSSSSATSGTPVLKSHAIFSDPETGIGAGFDNFMSNCDMHMFKMYGGMVYAVHAILGACSSTGWD
jgi:hypothetical protein